jgi:hypothetical protein
MSSEQAFGLPAQPPDTCPMIDQALGEIEEIQRLMRRWNKIDNLEDAKSMLDEIDTILFYRGKAMELLDKDIRKNCVALRDWGQAWKDLAKEHVKQEAQP